MERIREENKLELCKECGCMTYTIVTSDNKLLCGKCRKYKVKTDF